MIIVTLILNVGIKSIITIHPSLAREGQVDCVKLLASRGAGLDAKTEVE